MAQAASVQSSKLAYNPRVREAARTLHTEWLGCSETMATTPRCGPEVIAGSHHLGDSEFDSFNPHYGTKIPA